MRITLLFFVVLATVHFSANAQKNTVAKKYPSLFWEITGNGLTKPSYLFGTMHVSSKMVFHLSDSFYYAMRNTDAVALELNPEIWQDEMFRLQKAQINFARFSTAKMNDYLKESSFRLEKYEDDIKRAITEEPTVVNNLLYRSYQSSADFEENTYLDLYIYQTGRKLGKQPAGVENYLESERLMMEAYQDMAKDKSKKRLDPDGDNYYDLQKKIQQAYRNGDLDLMDSLQSLTSTSPAFSEKFLYLRNEIQANSIDTILKNHSLFVGVGAAHLPGARGVIELLRKKGFRLRPIFMQDRDASQKEEIDKLRVPVAFHTEATQDGMVQLQLPGKLYKREEARGNESWQYADMNNGSYYMLTRVRTHAALLGHSEKVVFRKVDSMLYENIPGKILKKTIITKNGYPGFDVTNRTRRGDLQRYELIVTPFEVLVFKMSGNDSYVDGKEADQFFSSIQVKPLAQNNWSEYEPVQGGFKLKMPTTVSVAYTKDQSDAAGRWEYESVDNSTGNAYMLWKKSLYNFNFIEEDTFDLAMMEESFKSSEIIHKQLSRSIHFQNKRPVLDSRFSLKEGGYITMRAFVKGPHYYLLAVMSRDKKVRKIPFLHSFRVTPYKYSNPQYYIDSILKIEVLTSVKPNVDTELRSWMERGTNDAKPAGENSYSGWAKSKTGIFKNDSTGESILVTLQTFPKYFYSADSAAFWNDNLDAKQAEKDMMFYRKKFFKLNDSVCGYQVLLTDTNSSRCIKATYYLQGNNLFKIATIIDTSVSEGNFEKSFFNTIKPIAKSSSPSVFSNKSNLFFEDFSSKDSITSKQATQAIPFISFGKNDLDKMVAAIGNLKYNDKDYFDSKSKLITELGYISDSSSKERIVFILKSLYEKNADTSFFQNAVLSGLSHLKTKSAYNLLKELLVQDPPVFEDSYEYGRIFDPFYDTLKLAKIMLPEIIQLASLEDYKPYVNSLLQSLSDSGYVKAADYESYFSKLFFDAKIELKKQQNKEEKQLEAENSLEDYDVEINSDYSTAYDYNADVEFNTSFSDYASLLIPFYDKFASVPKYFEKLLSSKDVNVQLAAAKVMIVSGKKIPDSLFASVASQEKYRAKLLNLLELVNRRNLFPKKYLNQDMIAKSLLLNDKNYKRFAEIELAGKRLIQLKGNKGMVYLYRYKMNKEDDWKMGISGLQPVNYKEVNSKADLVKLTNKKIKPAESEAMQFESQLQKMMFAKHKSFRRFYSSSDTYFSKDDFDNLNSPHQ